MKYWTIKNLFPQLHKGEGKGPYRDLGGSQELQQGFKGTEGGSLYVHATLLESNGGENVLQRIRYLLLVDTNDISSKNSSNQRSTTQHANMWFITPVQKTP